MKNILLSVVVISALVVAGVGGTFADFSDSEEEVGDSLQAGSLDLKVNGEDDPNVLPFHIPSMTPSKRYDATKTVINEGTIPGYLYIHFKNPLCIETNDKDINGDTVIDELDKPEPERVAEQGGKVQQKYVVGLGEACDMEEHVDVAIEVNGVALDLDAYDDNADGVIKLHELESHQIPLGQLPSQVEWDIVFIFHLQDIDEDDIAVDNDGDTLVDEDPIDGVDNDGDTLVDEDPPDQYFDENDEHEWKFDHWPTNRLMGDTLTFDVLFELLQVDP
jgi:hypothetical protein